MNRKPTERHEGMLLAVAFASLLLLSGCGSDAPAPRPSNLKPFTFELDWGGPEYIGFYMAQLLGYYDEAGLDVTIKTGGGSAIAAQGLLDGTIPLGTASANAIVRTAFEQLGAGSDPRGFPAIRALILPENPSVVILRKGLRVETPEDFAGLKLGYPSKASEAFQEFQALLDLNPGLEERINLTEFFLQGGQQFRSGEIDGLITYLMDVPSELEAEGVPFETVRLKNLGLNVPGQCIVVSPGAPIDPAQLEAFLRASYEGWEYVRRNPENAAKLYAAKNPQANPAKLGIIARHCADLLPPPSPGNTARAYTDPAAIRSSLMDSLDLILASRGWHWDEAERERFVAAFTPSASPSSIAAEAGDTAGAAGY